ncbi:uncharacterized protein F4812DRAFT_448723 [Daldinia caldariorum]|uniref:uncharacterized protein n=1 Tax=Daldinia caldariorum TaxID=326644 RepID=UPI0020084444|nr:uncharacterized protein F4812DRAFT_448723 [Daldinia caldariorum]KAI1462915.1 hypothetical protein F4812DRAFT_448723 [Daldinia caldariorum]
MLGCNFSNIPNTNPSDAPYPNPRLTFIMSNKSRFCPLCDILVDVWLNPHDNLTVANPDYRLNWLQAVRALRTKRGFDEPFITGVGWLDIEGNVISPLNYDSYYYDYEPHQDLHRDFATHRVGYPQREPAEYWCYVIHDACWDLLRDRVNHYRQVSVNDLARHLFALLINTPVSVESETLAPGHDYGHASQFHLRDGELSSSYFTRVNSTSYSFITGDITEEFVPDEESLDDEVKSFHAYLANSCVIHRGYSVSDPFLLLPRELIVLILTHLPSRDVCNLRLASRHTASLSPPELLDQTFWSSRFDPDFEMGFVFAGPSNPRPRGPTDWRTLYLKAKGALRSDLFHGFRNRRRIYHIFQHITDSLYVRLQNDSGLDEPLCRNPAHFPQQTVFAEASFYPSNANSTESLSLGCRLFRRQDFLWPHHSGSIPQRLRASFVYSNGKSYISGFRLLGADPSSLVYCKAGLINLRNEHEIFLEPHSSVKHIEAAMEAKGLVGLRLHIQGSQGPYAISIGNMELPDPRTGICTLIPGCSTECVGFHLAFDACKIISISLIEKPAASTQSYIEKFDPTEIWNPCIPKFFPEWPSIPCSPRGFNLCLNMNFGGTNGQLLRSLVRIDALMGNYPSVFVGILFSYVDGSERFYGRKSFRNSLNDLGDTPAIRQGFPIDGPGGEVMTKIAVNYCSDAISAITVTTGLGREMQFRLYGKEYVEGAEQDGYVLQAKPGMCFTTFYAKAQSPLGHFRNFSARCQVLNKDSQLFPEKAAVTHYVPITSETLSSAEDMLTYSGGFAITTAVLSRLRKVRVSVGDMEETGSPRRITGLWLEYYDCAIPIIVGQWVNEIGSFEIPLGDRISEVITWHDYPNQYKEIKYGSLRKLQIRTAHGIAKEFEEDHRNAEICLEYRENPYEYLSSIVWGYNHQWDHIRVFHTSKTDRPSSRLLMGSAGYLLPSWSVAQRAFMQDTCEDGSPNPVVAIQVTYRNVTNELVGICFIHEDGRSVTLGIGLKEAKIIPISPDDKLARVEIGGTRQNHILYMNFLTTSGQKIDFSVLSLEKINRRVTKRTVFILDRSCPDQLGVAGAKLCQIPEGAGVLTGFWTVPRRRGGLRYGRFGPIFESSSEDT